MNACTDCLNWSLLSGLATGALVDRSILQDEARRVVGRHRERCVDDQLPIDSRLKQRLARREDRLLAQSSAAPVWPLCVHDDRFPAELRELSDCPRVVYGCGSEAALDRLLAEPAVALVGARRASPGGREVTYRLGRELAAAGVTVVSGMAFGIDAAAHRGALSADGITVAVLAGSPGTAYPAAHAALHCQIADSGLVLSEFPPGTRVAKWGFPARNRLIAALAQLTVAVEGREGSGALHTTEFAAQLGRVVAAVPGPVTSPLSTLPNGLLYDGAQMVRDGRDALELIFGPQTPQAQLPGPGLPSVAPELRGVLDAVSEGAGTPEAVATRLGDLSPAEARSRLGRLELLGVLRRDLSGGYVVAG